MVAIVGDARAALTNALWACEETVHNACVAIKIDFRLLNRTHAP